jgi:DNA (cytosine-5)-methyltransferase 1
LKAISLFTGVGGLDYGFEAAGFVTAAAVERDPIACRTLRLNRPWPILEGDIADITSDAILSAAGLTAGEADVLIGGPPCQPFSKSAYWATGDAARLEDPRADTLTQYLRVLGDTRPKAFLLENVLGLGYSGKSEGLDFIRRGVARINLETGTQYSLTVMALNAADFGVPQHRERLFVVGVRDGRDFKRPPPTHGEHHGRPPFLTAWDALGDLPADPQDPDLNMTGKWADLLPSIPEGQNYLWHTARGGGAPLFGWRTRFWNFLLKLAKDRPSWTIQAQPGPATGPFHWNNRKLSTAELGRLQTFPDGLRFDCKRADIQKLTGNAVPSALAEVIALALAEQALGQRPVSDKVSLLPARRSDLPAQTAPMPLPTQFSALIGVHADHPGTGKGRRASERLFEAA